MSPTSNNAGMELPPPSGGEQAPLPAAPAEYVPQVSESQPARHELSSKPSSTPPPAPPISIPTPTSVPVSTTDDNAKPSDDSTTRAKLLKDKDLIEKEWVNKAKAIIAKTKEDPYKQNTELTMLKADYMKKHFNKTLKVT